MGKLYTQKENSAAFDKEFETLQNMEVYAEPSKQSVANILAYSKSLSVKQSSEVGEICLNLN